MATYYQNLINGVLGDGARATKFDVDIIFTNNELFNNPAAMRSLAKATTFPGKNHDVIDFKYKGRSIPLKGQTKYQQSWTCTFYLTEDHALKNAFETWIEGLDQKHNYFAKTNEVKGLELTQKKHAEKYGTDITLYQKNFDNDQDTALYKLYNVFPTEVSTVEYSSESLGQIQEFTVTFAYSHYNSAVIKGGAGNFIDDLIDKGMAVVGDTIDDLMNAAGEVVNSALTTGKENISDLLNSLTSNGKSGAAVNKQFARSTSTMVKTMFDIK